MASLFASVRGIYSALVDDKATVDCFFELELIGPPERMPILALTEQYTRV